MMIAQKPCKKCEQPFTPTASAQTICPACKESSTTARIQPQDITQEPAPLQSPLMREFMRIYDDSIDQIILIRNGIRITLS